MSESSGGVVDDDVATPWEQSPAERLWAHLRPKVQEMDRREAGLTVAAWLLIIGAWVSVILGLSGFWAGGSWAIRIQITHFGVAEQFLAITPVLSLMIAQRRRRGITQVFRRIVRSSVFAGAAVTAALVIVVLANLVARDVAQQLAYIAVAVAIAVTNLVAMSFEEALRA